MAPNDIKSMDCAEFAKSMIIAETSSETCLEWEGILRKGHGPQIGKNDVSASRKASRKASRILIDFVLPDKCSLQGGNG